MRPSRRRLTEQGADLAARNKRLIAERDDALEGADAYKAAAKTAARQFKEADEKYVDVCLDNQRLTKDLAAARRELAAVRKVEESLARQIHEMAQPVEPSDEEVDAAQLRLELDAERRRADELQQRLDVANSRPTDSHWRAEARREKKRADGLQKRLDDAVGLPPGGILNSAPWQPGYKTERDKQVSS